MVNSSYVNATGHSNSTFLVTVGFNNGNQTWYGYVDSDDNCYKANNTENLTVEVQVNWPPLYENETIQLKEGKKI